MPAVPTPAERAPHDRAGSVLRDQVRRLLLVGHHRSLRGADALDRSGARPGALAHLWAVLKLALTAVLGPVGGPILFAVAARNTARTDDAIAAYPALLDDVLAGRPAPTLAGRVERADAGSRWVITSDLHRGPDSTMDLPTQQHTAGLYAAMLDVYADDGFGLVEAGDVEDFWLVGGSAYGVAYDLWRMVTGALAAVVGRAPLDAVYRTHLRRIVAQHEPIYDRIQERFHAAGRYRRLAGNHDDVYNHPAPVEALAAIFPGLTVADFLVLDGPEGPVGIVTHGHHTDSWNGPWSDGLGKLSTSLASMLYDLPLLTLRPGIATPEQTDAVVGGRWNDRLMAINATFGANAALYSVDEERLHDACRAGFGTDDDGQARGPILVLGHTHAPLVDPRTVDGAATWRRYWNTGSGVFHQLVTAVEWDGTLDPMNPRVTLVAWRWRPERPDELQRLELERTPDGDTLRVREAVTA